MASAGAGAAPAATPAPRLAPGPGLGPRVGANPGAEEAGVSATPEGDAVGHRQRSRALHPVLNTRPRPKRRGLRPTEAAFPREEGLHGNQYDAENASGWTVAEVRPGGRLSGETRPSPPRPSADRTPSRVRGFAAVTALRISRQSERPGFTSRVLTCRPGCPHGRARPRGGDRGRRHGGEREPRGREPGTSGLQSRGQARGSPSETGGGRRPAAHRRQECRAPNFKPEKRVALC